MEYVAIVTLSPARWYWGQYTRKLTLSSLSPQLDVCCILSIRISRAAADTKTSSLLATIAFPVSRHNIQASSLEQTDIFFANPEYHHPSPNHLFILLYESEYHLESFQSSRLTHPSCLERLPSPTQAPRCNISTNQLFHVRLTPKR